MDNDPQQESIPRDNPPPQHVPAQESFGPPFPAVLNDAYRVPIPPAYSPQPGQGPSTSYQAQPAYGYAPAYSVPLPYGYVGPQPGAYYGPPPNDFPLPPSAPLPLGTALRQLPRQYWRVLTKPKARTFLEEQGKAAWNIIWMQLLFLGIVESLVVLAVVFLEFFLIQMLIPSSGLFSQAAPIVAAIGVAVCFVFVLISFFAGSGILYGIAKAFGGQGTFLSYAYSYSLVTIPIGMLSIVLYIIPCLGSLAVLAGAVYSVILLIFMTMGVMRLSGGKASAAVLIPIGTGFVLLVGAYVAYFVWIFSMISSTLPHH